MRVTYLPVLQILRDLYSQPPDMQRFRRYLRTLTGGSGDVVLPITVANPMAREHALIKLDELLSRGAEDVGAQAAAAANSRLSGVPIDLEIKASIVLADDVGGGWTNRYTTEASTRFPRRGALKRPFAVALAWTSETPTSAQLRQEVLAATYRVAYHHRRGLPGTLGAMLEQEGLAGVFAGQQPRLDHQALVRSRAVIDALDPENTAYPALFAALYGDEAAAQLGYQSLGVPPRAGFEVALAEALERQRDPLLALRTTASVEC